MKKKVQELLEECCVVVFGVSASRLHTCLRASVSRIGYFALKATFWVRFRILGKFKDSLYFSIDQRFISELWTVRTIGFTFRMSDDANFFASKPQIRAMDEDFFYSGLLTKFPSALPDLFRRFQSFFRRKFCRLTITAKSSFSGQINLHRFWDFRYRFSQMSEICFEFWNSDARISLRIYQ